MKNNIFKIKLGNTLMFFINSLWEFGEDRASVKF